MNAFGDSGFRYMNLNVMICVCKHLVFLVFWIPETHGWDWLMNEYSVCLTLECQRTDLLMNIFNSPNLNAACLLDPSISMQYF